MSIAECQRVVFLFWPHTHPLVAAEALAVLHSANRMAERDCYRVEYCTLDGQPLLTADGWSLQAGHWQDLDESVDQLWLVADAAVVPEQLPAGLAIQLRGLQRAGVRVGALEAGVFALALAGLLERVACAVHWRLLDEFRLAFPQIEADSQLYVSDQSCCSSGGGQASADLLLHLLAEDFGQDLAALVSEDLVAERIREGNERQRVPLRNRLGSTHPKLTEAVILMESNIEEPLTTDEIARHVCVSRRQLERIFKQYLNSVPSQYYLELRLNRARQMLLQTSKSVIQIGLSCGFSSGPHFSSAYRNFFGVTPREDRNQRRAQQAAEAARE
ncbi:MAG: GlxA family transcriptional regulator [Halopseudomonas yangmingensis]|uniref:Transcriptional regulator GlxA family, contains an amidase domain and an AraC-type DNA-binding HTH domain n=1 Tax=Halopseudomonas yangmingensis TaxID=1720063 RepID=A0A1I4NKV2_9GAMM|nr:GlxA family transcriptional regulator [Halopseudomonas yangmingensis]SFM16005.1 Transcriptional regulator GlxA family, contains an amidase domain and an AraC-type DNA-binding HTH domain [Halopseudomonas yangmingensis]